MKLAALWHEAVRSTVRAIVWLTLPSLTWRR
jgi:hypothetical protein